jgi:hypothetical protein
MAKTLRQVFSTIVWGGILAGPLAALVVMEAPASWRGPLIPVAVLIVSVGSVALWRRATTRRRADRAPRLGDGPER